MVESQSSYISRLAEVHCVTVGSLIGKEIAPVLGKDYLTKSCKNGGSRFYEVGSELNGFGNFADDFAQGLTELTGCNSIKNLTLVDLHDLLPTRGVLRQTKAWCPLCLEDWKKSKQDIYEPLLWNFKEVNICGIHGIRLKNQCPFCAKEIPVLSRKSRNGFCSFCGCWLGSPDYKIDIEITLDKVLWEYFVVENIESLLETKDNLALSPSVKAIHTVLKSIIDKAGGKSAFSRNFGIPKTTVRTWYEGSHKPSLKALLEICYAVGVEFKEAFGPNQKLIGFAKYDNYALPEKPGKIKVSKRKFDWFVVESALIDVINRKIIPPPSVREVARNLQCDKKLLYAHFATQCGEISKKHTSFVQMRKTKRIEDDCQKVSEATVILYNSGIYPSRRKVEKYLSPNIILREKAYQMAWKETLASLGLGLRKP